MGFEASDQEKELAATVLSKIDSQGIDVAVRDQADKLFAGIDLPRTTLDKIWDIADPESTGILNKDQIAKALRLIGWAQAEKAPEPELLERVGPLATVKGIPIPGVGLFGGMSNYQSAISSYQRPTGPSCPKPSSYGQSLKVSTPVGGMYTSSGNSSSSNLSVQGSSYPRTPSSTTSTHPIQSYKLGARTEPAKTTPVPEVRIEKDEQPVPSFGFKTGQDTKLGKARESSPQVEPEVVAAQAKLADVQRDLQKVIQGFTEEMGKMKEEMSKMREEMEKMRRQAGHINADLLSAQKKLDGGKTDRSIFAESIQDGRRSRQASGHSITAAFIKPDVSLAEVDMEEYETEKEQPELFSTGTPNSRLPLGQSLHKISQNYSKPALFLAFCSTCVLYLCFRLGSSSLT